MRSGRLKVRSVKNEFDETPKYARIVEVEIEIEALEEVTRGEKSN